MSWFHAFLFSALAIPDGIVKGLQKCRLAMIFSQAWCIGFTNRRTRHLLVNRVERVLDCIAAWHGVYAQVESQDGLDRFNVGVGKGERVERFGHGLSTIARSIPRIENTSRSSSAFPMPGSISAMM